ncbi:ATP synthase F1 subunit delta [Patescibacteria group bacterium]
MELQASQYAESIIELGLSEDEFDNFQKYLWAFYKLFHEDKRFRNFVIDPNTSYKKKVTWIAENTTDSFARFILVVVKNEDIEKLKLIIKKLEESRDDVLGVARVSVSSAHKLPQETLDEIEQKLEQRLGKKIRLIPKVNPAVIGGLRIRIGDELIEDTCIQKIEKLHKQFVQTKFMDKHAG